VTGGTQSLAAWRNERLHQQSPSENRTPGQRDCDRVLYTPSFRRLQAVTQVILAADEGYLQHNRLTHSLKVAQIARRIAEWIEQRFTQAPYAAAIDERGGLNPDVVEAAGLAHDMGHPPFGHIAEYELQARLGDLSLADTFEGNAQTFRIVTKLAAIDPRFSGLDLTRATLNAILKYPWLRVPPTDTTAGDAKWGAYQTEENEFDWARGGKFQGRDRSLEADIMDWADDIAYAIHDVEDFFRVGLVPLRRLRDHDSEVLSPVFSRVAQRLATERDPAYRMDVDENDLESAWGETLSTFTLSTYSESATDRARLYAYTSGLIGGYVRGTGLRVDGTLDVTREHRVQIALLKELTKSFVVEAPALATQQRGQRQVVQNLFNAYMNELKVGIDDKSVSATAVAALFPTRMTDDVLRLVESTGGIAERGRVVADTIAGMTEAQALRIHHRFMGFDFGSFTDPAVS
jgi:dGTPase